MSFSFNSGFKSKLDSAVTSLLDRIGSQAAERARELAPIDTGKLRASIGHLVRQEDRAVIIYADMFYAEFVEMGTYRMPARPFLRPALLAMGRGVGGIAQFPGTPALKSAPRTDTETAHANARVNAGLHERMSKTNKRMHRGHMKGRR
jgi:HK97 gp10 family phage protein